jgi:hypothetical protein
VLFHDFRGAAAVLPLAKRYGLRMTSSPLLMLLSFCEALVALRDRDDSRSRSQRARVVRVNLARLRRWSRWGGQLVEAKILMLEAETAWQDGQNTFTGML